MAERNAIVLGPVRERRVPAKFTHMWRKSDRQQFDSTTEERGKETKKKKRKDERTNKKKIVSEKCIDGKSCSNSCDSKKKKERKNQHQREREKWKSSAWNQNDVVCVRRHRRCIWMNCSFHSLPHSPAINYAVSEQWIQPHVKKWKKKTLKEKWIGALFWNMRNCCLEFEAAAMPRVQLNKMEWNNIKYDPANRVAKKPFKIARIRAPRQRERKKRRVVFGRTSQIHHHCRSLRILYYWRNTRNRMLIGVWRLRAHHHLEGPLEIDEINLILFFFGLVLRPFWRTPRENDFGRCQKWAARCVRQPGCDLRHADNPCESHRKALGAQNKKLCSLDADNSNCKKNNNNRAAARKIK